MGIPFLLTDFNHVLMRDENVTCCNKRSCKKLLLIENPDFTRALPCDKIKTGPTMNLNSAKSLDLLNNLLDNTSTLSLYMSKPFISEMKFAFRIKPLYWTSVLPAVIFEIH